MGSIIRAIQTQEDFKDIIKLYRTAWEDKDMLDLLENLDSAECFVLDAEGQVRGYIFIEKSPQGFLEVLDIVIQPRYKGKGYGTRLLNAVLEMSDARLMVQKDDPETFRFYRKNRFIKIGEYENYYGVGANGIRMERKCRKSR